jgi:hypothetical protein
MPWLDGAQLARAIAEKAPMQANRIIFVTGAGAYPEAGLLPGARVFDQACGARRAARGRCSGRYLSPSRSRLSASDLLHAARSERISSGDAILRQMIADDLRAPGAIVKRMSRRFRSKVADVAKNRIQLYLDGDLVWIATRGEDDTQLAARAWRRGSAVDVEVEGVELMSLELDEHS